MNVLAHRALLADNERSRRARVWQALVGELPGLEVEEAGGPQELFRSLEGRRFDLTVVRHPLLDNTETLLSLLDDVTDQRHVRAERDQLIESERRALARELHDEVGHVLAGLKFQLERGWGRLPDEVHSLLGQLSSRVRELSMDLRPPMLDEMGLLPTLLWHFERYHAQTGIRVDFRQAAPVGRLPRQVETAAFRIVQEALTNVARHAGVGKASVRLDAHPDRIVLRVEDRGAGFSPEAAWAGPSSGLGGMRYRARLAGGRFVVDSAPGKGTRLTAELPRAAVEGRAG